MKQKLFLVFSLFVTHVLFAQTSGLLYVSFDNSIDFSNKQKSETDVIKKHLQISESYDFELVKAIDWNDEKWDYLSLQAIKNVGNDASVQKLKNIFLIKSDLSLEQLKILQSELVTNKEVNYCELLNTSPVIPPYDIAPATPDFTVNQTYLNPNPGVNMRYAWTNGFNGQSIKVRDVEYGFNKNNEEFNDTNISLEPNVTINPDCTTAYTEHGTATMGVLFAQNGSYGVTGMAFGVSEVVLYPEWTSEYGYNRTRAIAQAIGNSQAGDIIVFEMQTYGFEGSDSNPKFVPAEYNSLVWDLTKVATDAGIIVVAAAGNGSQNLDSSDYLDYINRGNSGAILVGAGTATTSHNRKSFSTYGSRVDVQGWGENVYTTGYITLSSLGSDFNQTYTSGFSGTSSATIVVASCVTVLQSYYFDKTGSYLSPDEMNQILKITGIAQGTSVAGHIGPLPDMQAAMLYIDVLLDTKDYSNNTIIVYPNPVHEMLFIDTKTQNTEVEIFDVMGKKVQTSFLSQNSPQIDMKNFPQGIYFLKIFDGEKYYSQKVIKN